MEKPKSTRLNSLTALGYYVIHAGKACMTFFNNTKPEVEKLGEELDRINIEAEHIKNQEPEEQVKSVKQAFKVLS